MRSEAANPKEYLDSLPDDRQAVMKKLHAVVSKNLPKGFESSMSYGMLTYVVPHTIYPKGYHCDPKQALPFMSIASQKNFIAVYHMGIYANKALHDWFVLEYAKTTKLKLDMGKSCIRFKKPEQIPVELIGTLATKLTVKDWINLYETNLKR